MLNNSDFIAGLCSKQKDISQHCCLSARTGAIVLQFRQPLADFIGPVGFIRAQTVHTTVLVVVVVVELSMGSMSQHCKGWGRIAITGTV